MSNLLFPCRSCGIWHDASLQAPESQASAERAPDGGVLALQRRADDAEQPAIARYLAARDAGSGAPEAA